MKKNLAIVLALIVVLCAAVASAAVYAPYTGELAGVTHKFIADPKAPESYTDMACIPTAKGAATVTTEITYISDLCHEVVTTTVQPNVCSKCGAVMEPTVTIVSKVEDHSTVRGAYIDRVALPNGETAITHNDVTHLVGYDVYEAACTVCKSEKPLWEYVPVYKAHTFTTKNPIGMDAAGNAIYGKKGSTCQLCGYTRAYKALTTAAGQKVEAIIAAYEAAGKTVEFDADQLIAVGIEEGEVADVEGCGVATIQFTNFTPVKKGDTNKAVTDQDSDIYGAYSNGKTSIKSTDKWGSDGFGAAIKTSEAAPTDLEIEAWTVAGKIKNINQDVKSYDAAFVTMYVDGEAHRVYFYNRHDKAGWVYAFEADMAEGTYKVGKLSDTAYDKSARAARCGAGQEYATVGAYFVGTELNTIGTAYATEGYNTTWKWAMVDDFEFVCIGK